MVLPTLSVSMSHPDCLCFLLRRIGYYYDALHHSIYNVSKSCRPCARTSLPHRSWKVSPAKLLSSFNAKIQIAFMWMSEVTTLPIVHTFDVSTSYSEYVIVPNRETSSDYRLSNSYCFTFMVILEISAAI